MIKHIVHVGVGAMSPTEAKAYVEEIRKTAEGFFPPKGVLFMPHRGDSSHVETVYFD